MDLIILYGPPAAGKLTIAEHLARRMGTRVFHNQLTVDIVTCLFEFGTDPYNKLIENLRGQVFKAAAHAKGPGLIFTFVYSHPIDLRIIRKRAREFEKAGNKVHYYQIVCDRAVLMERVRNESRKRFAKVRTAPLLGKILKQHDLFTPIPGVRTLTLDSGKLTPARASRLIFEDLP